MKYIFMYSSTIKGSTQKAIWKTSVITAYFSQNPTKHLSSEQ